MAKLALNKTSLNREGKKLKAYRQFVPALDLKRKQLLSARQECRQSLLESEESLREIRSEVEEQLPMLAGSGIRLESLLKVSVLEIQQINLVGLELPELKKLEVETALYSHLLQPHWLSPILELQRRALRCQVEMELQQQRLLLLEQGLQKTTQRLNLFDKVLIPQAQNNMRKIRIALSDAERAGVVRAKIAKNKRRRLSLG